MRIQHRHQMTPNQTQLSHNARRELSKQDVTRRSILERNNNTHHRYTVDVRSYCFMAFSFIQSMYWFKAHTDKVSSYCHNVEAPLQCTRKTRSAAHASFSSFYDDGHSDGDFIFVGKAFHGCSDVNDVRRAATALSGQSSII